MRRMRPKIYAQGIRLPEFFKHRRLILISALFFAGILTGALLVRGNNASLRGTISNMFADYYKARSGQTVLRTFFLSLLSFLPYYLAVFVAGVSALGIPVALFIPYIRGIGLGIISGYLYAVYGLSGFLFSAVLIVPQSLVSAIALILASREALSFSAVFFSLLRPKTPAMQLSSDAKMYAVRFGFLLLLAAVSSLLDALMAAAFLGFFKF